MSTSTDRALTALAIAASLSVVTSCGESSEPVASATGGSAGTGGEGASGGAAVGGTNGGGQPGSDSGTSGSGSGGDAGDCSPNCPRPWEAITSEIIGFGRETTGGRGADFCRVTTLEDDGPNSLRACAEQSAPAWIVFDVSGTITLTRAIDVQSNKTIDGRGQRITLTQHGLSLSGVENVIVHNLRLVGTTEPRIDVISLYGGTRHVWINHCDLSAYTDGLVDITVQSTDVTVSFNRMYDHGKVMLISASDNETADEVIRVTSHHNYILDTEERHPRLRFGKAHAFNNYIARWRFDSMRSHFGGELLAENNIFEVGDSQQAVRSLDDGFVRVTGNWVLGTASLSEHMPQNVFSPTDFYPYSAQPADEALRSELVARAGWQDVPLPE